MFSGFLTCVTGTKSHKASHLCQRFDLTHSKIINVQKQRSIKKDVFYKTAVPRKIREYYEQFWDNLFDI